MAQQIQASNITNKSRLRVLNARQQVLDSTFEDARKKLPLIQKDTVKYQSMLKNLILEVCSRRCWQVLIVGDVCVDG